MEPAQKKGMFFSVRTKLLLLLACLIFFFIVGSVASLVGFYRINQSSTIITEREGPFVRTIEEALFAILQAQSAAEGVLDIDDPARVGEIVTLKETLTASNDRFEMFIAAITWGSETDAFRQSDGGRNHALWTELGYDSTLIVQESPPTQAENAGRISIYYGGYINNVERAIEEREKYLALLDSEASDAEAARALSKEFQTKARRFTELTAEHLRLMIELSNEATAQSATALKETEDNVRGITLILSVIGLLISVAIGISFAEKIIAEPIRMLTKAAQAFGTGNFTERVTIRSRDEMAVLGSSFNEMAQKLSEYTKGLESEVAKRTKELHERLEELRIANAQLKVLDSAKSEFISVAAHQLRTPLSAVKWVLGLLMDKEHQNLTPEQRSWIFKGYESNERMISLINEMLIVTRIESGRERFQFAPVHMEDLLDSVILDFVGQAHVRNINLSFNKPVTSLPALNIDSDKMRAVVQNLIENSMRYTDDGGTITLGMVRQDGFVQVSVSDNGIGIPDHQRNNIFNKFFRADNAVKRQTDGSGLGLFISKSIVEKHGGKIWFDSAVGKGTTFTFTIPINSSS